MLKVLQITEAFGGGVFFSVSRVCNGLAQAGHEVTLLYSKREELPDDFRKSLHSHVQLIEIPMSTSIHPYRDLKNLIQIKQLISSLNPDIIHLHSSKAGGLGRIAAWFLRKNKKTFYSPRGLAFLKLDVSPSKRKIYLIIERALARLGGRILACSKSEFNEVLEVVKTKNVTLIENAIDVEKIPEKAPGNNLNSICIGTVGRISPQKNPEEFIRLASELRSSNLRFVWVGGGEDPEMVGRLQNAGVEVTGWLTREQVLNRLTALDIYVQTSLWEGMPLSVIEAQVAGIPAVVRNVVGNRDVVINHETGIIYSNYQDLKKSVDDLIKDEKIRRSMGKQARRLGLIRFSFARLIKELERVYQATVDRTD